MAMQNLHRDLIRAAAKLVHKRLSSAPWLANGLLLLLFSMPANAQLRVVADGSTVTTLANSADCTSTCLITGTSIAGENLFHSFSEFNIPEGVAVIFNDGGATNIFSRVSDSTQASTILGNLVVGPGAANFFLINPAGITFGPNAELRLNGGAFVASTAERINFLNNDAFIAGTVIEPVQLTISTPVGLQFGNTAASIVNQSQAGSVTNTLGAPAGLFNPLSTLALIGGNLTLFEGNLTAPGGNIALGSVAPESEINLLATSQGFEFSYDSTETYQDIQILGSLIDVGGPGGGQVNLQGREANLVSSGIFGVTFGPFERGEINLNADQLNLTNSVILGITSSLAQGPDLNLRVNELTMTNGSVLSAETQGPGNGGQVTIQGHNQTYTDVVMLDTSGLGTEVVASATGQGGDVIIQTKNLRLQDNAGIVANTFGPGNGGNINITAVNETTLEDASSLGTLANEFQQNPTAPSGIGIITSGVGDAGNILLTTGQLTVQDGSQIGATTFGDAGNGGQIAITADAITLMGASENGRLSGILSQVEPGRFTGNLSDSQGGDILINADLIKLPGQGIISATALEAGNAGNITLSHVQRLEITGNGSSTSAAGIFAIGQGNAEAGEIDVIADHIRLTSGAQITASTETTDGGNITLRGVEDIIMRETSRISAQAGEGGSGGNIIIETPFLIAIPGENSDIIATAVNGPGGNIQITASSILGLVERAAATDNDTNDIDASSLFGINGTVTINRPDVEPDQGLANLPESLADAANQVGESCGTANTSTMGRFTITGRGGLPPNPEAALRERHIFTDLNASNQETQQASPANFESGLTSNTSAPLPVVEAQGWATGAGGEVIFTLSAMNHTPNGSQLFYPQCRHS